MPGISVSACTPFSCEVRPAARIQLGGEAVDEPIVKHEHEHQLVQTAAARQMLEQHNEVIREIQAQTLFLDQSFEKRNTKMELHLRELFSALTAVLAPGGESVKDQHVSAVPEQQIINIGQSVLREASDMKQTAPPYSVADDRPKTEQMVTIPDKAAILLNFHHVQNLNHGFSRLAAAEEIRGNSSMSMLASDSGFLDAQKERLTRAVVSNTFDMVSGILVVLNSIYMALEIELKGMDAGQRLGFGTYTGPALSRMDPIFNVLDHVFCILFIVEIMLRILVHGKSFFKHVLNCLDLFVVFMSALENYILVFVGYSLPHISVVRLIRLVKLVKAVRVARLMSFCHPLRVLLVSIASSAGALFWSAILLILLQIISAIGITQALQDFLGSDTEDIQLQKQVFTFFGRCSYSLLTMFEITLAPGAWANIGRILIFKVSSIYVLFFIPYVSLVTFAIMRVITAIFLRNTMSAASNDDETSYHERVLKSQADTARLQKIFEEGDKDHGGDISRREFKRLFKDERVIAWLSAMGLDIREAEGLFSLLDDGDGLITFQEFMSGILRLRGGAKTLDLATLLLENKKIHIKLDHLRQELGVAKLEGVTKAKMKATDLFLG